MIKKLSIVHGIKTGFKLKDYCTIRILHLVGPDNLQCLINVDGEIRLAYSSSRNHETGYQKAFLISRGKHYITLLISDPEDRKKFIDEKFTIIFETEILSPV